MNIGYLIKGEALERYGKYDPTDWSDWCGACPQSSLALFGMTDTDFRVLCFDINRWYNCRCPPNLGTSWDKRFFSIIRVTPQFPDTYRVNSASLVQFNSGQCGGGLIETDEYYSEPNEPSAASFQLELINRESSGVYVDVHEIMGNQENALYCLSSSDGGIAALCEPDEAYKKLEIAGLTTNKIQHGPNQLSLKDALLRSLVF